MSAKLSKYFARVWEFIRFILTLSPLIEVSPLSEELLTNYTPLFPSFTWKLDRCIFAINKTYKELDYLLKKCHFKSVTYTTMDCTNYVPRDINKGHRLWMGQVRVLSLGLQFIVLEGQLDQVWNQDNDSTHLIGLLWQLGELLSSKRLEEYLEHITST